MGNADKVLPDLVLRKPLPFAVLVVLVLAALMAGTLLWCRDGFREKSDRSLHVKPLDVRWYTVMLCGSAFLLVPEFLKWTGLLQRIHRQAIDGVFYSGFAVECVLVLFFLITLRVSEKMRCGLRDGNFSIRLCVCEFLKILPLLLVTVMLWVPFLNLLRYCGLPITVEAQPLMQLLSKGHASAWSLAAIGCGAAFLAPICEEIFFRGILLRFFCSFLPLSKSLWLSSFIFAAMHGNWLAFLPIVVIGYRLGLNYVKSQNLIVGMCIHGFFNAFNFTLAVAYAHFYA